MEQSMELTAGEVVEEELELADAAGCDDGLPQAAKAKAAVSRAPKTRAGRRPDCACRVFVNPTCVM